MPNLVHRSASSGLSVALIGGESNGMEPKDIYSEIMYCRTNPLPHRVQSQNRFKPFKGWIWLFPICVFTLMLIGCGGDEILTAPIRHTVEISELVPTSQTLDPGATTTVAVTFNYSGDEADLIFRWEASSGQIIGSTSSVTYVASDVPGAHTITLELTDGFAVAEESVTVEVIALQPLLIDSDTYWVGQGERLVLKYQVSVVRILHQPVLLRYSILQDEAEVGAFLSLEVNGNLLVREAAIGEVQPIESGPIVGEVDVSGIITGPATYEITVTLFVLNPVERGWLLQKAEVIGVEGSSVRL